MQILLYYTIVYGPVYTVPQQPMLKDMHNTMLVPFTKIPLLKQRISLMD